MSIAIILSTILTLVLVTGAKRTWVTIVATLSGTFLCVGITELLIQF